MHQNRTTMILVYKTDNWHSYASRDIIAICRTSVRAIAMIKKHAKKNGEKLSKEDLQFLRDKKQTQRASGDGEYQFEDLPINELL